MLPLRNFLLVISSNLGPILLRFRDVADFLLRNLPPLFRSKFGLFPLTKVLLYLRHTLMYFCNSSCGILTGKFAANWSLKVLPNFRVYIGLPGCITSWNIVYQWLFVLSRLQRNSSGTWLHGKVKCDCDWKAVSKMVIEYTSSCKCTLFGWWQISWWKSWSCEQLLPQSWFWSVVVTRSLVLYNGSR